jgi:hypothetical protein
VCWRRLVSVLHENSAPNSHQEELNEAGTWPAFGRKEAEEYLVVQMRDLQEVTGDYLQGFTRQPT